MAAKTLLSVDAPDASYWLSKLFSEIYSDEECQPVTLPWKLIIDSEQLQEGLFLFSPVLDKRLGRDR